MWHRIRSLYSDRNLLRLSIMTPYCDNFSAVDHDLITRFHPSETQSSAAHSNSKQKIDIGSDGCNHFTHNRTVIAKQTSWVDTLSPLICLAFQVSSELPASTTSRKGLRKPTSVNLPDTMPPTRPDGPREDFAGPESGPVPPFPIKLSGPVVKGFGRGSREVSFDLVVVRDGVMFSEGGRS